ncbi:NmrA family transcriptional regulator [Natronospirillum operosum]|uniref:NmrA family transcriptional regulator n=1 Tax=Natronospirillum operosum TaxID=2759953 RepID=A0A4Z0WAZ8_9GAMM|nr:NAD(P)H-binding protein [Natronospirillum operosum]TGG92911.1 NmrA family transcriptional regulator [Natronospirillum operosum]
MSQSTFLVIGATGKTGRRIVQRLQAQGEAVRAVSRGSAPAFDWEQPEHWLPALSGIEVAYISYYPDLAAPGSQEAIAELIRQAKTAGVRKLVLLSGRGEQNAERCEQLVRDSGLAFTLIRASWFYQNFSEGHLLESVNSGLVALPAGEVREPFVDVDDIADVAVAAMRDDRHNGELYEVTGPRLLTFHEAVAEIAAVTGKPLQYVPITLAQFHAGLTASVDAPTADLLTSLCEEVFDGRNEALADGVGRALGRPPLDFGAFCRDRAAAGVWRATAAPAVNP